MKLRAIVADDSIIFRKAVRDCLANLRDVEVIDVAKDGLAAIDKIKRRRPDIVTLDVEMPGLNGLQVLEAIQKEKIDTNVIMISSHTQRGASTTNRALQMGAFDFILKPDRGNSIENINELNAELTARIDALRRRVAPPKSVPKPLPTARHKTATATRSPSKPAGTTNRTNGKPIPSFLDAICIGISTGGPKALADMIPKLPKAVSVPILVVQHMPPLFTATMAEGLDQTSNLKVVEATDGMPLRGGHVYIAPGGKQMRVGGYAGAWTAEITDDPAIKACKPSVDYLFRSAANQFKDRLLAIVMTGMGDDGLEGCRAVSAKGGCIWAQDQASSTVFGMPHQIIKADLQDEIRSLKEIGDGISNYGCRLKAAR